MTNAALVPASGVTEIERRSEMREWRCAFYFWRSACCGLCATGDCERFISPRFVYFEKVLVFPEFLACAAGMALGSRCVTPSPVAGPNALTFRC